MRRCRRPHGPIIVLLAVLEFLVRPVATEAQGHGPIYGLSTPTLGKGGWSLDVGTMGRFLSGRRSIMVRPMMSYGLTEDVQFAASVPLPLTAGSGEPSGRGFARMPSTRDLELGVGWRLQRRAMGVGARQETTVWLALEQPLDDHRRGRATAPGAFGAVVTGYASRTVYAWVGGAGRRYAAREGSRPGDTVLGSLVLGWRPAAFREDYPKPDWRGFLEVIGEWTGADVLDGREVEGSGGRQLFVAPTVLGLYGWWGVAAGPAFPILQDRRGQRPRERFRFALNFTFWW